MDRSALLQSIEHFPTCPGVYLFKDRRDHLLYVGKSANLRSRVRSYFTTDHTDRPFVAAMLPRVDHVEWIATETETEALILEANLIRTHTPPYNVELKDDKHYPYLKITLSEHFPRLVVARRVENDGSRYFGPYTEAGAMRRVMSYAKRIFRVRDCSRRLPLPRPARPCINYSIGRCSGACAGLISAAAYRERVEHLTQFLRGRRNELLSELEQRMHDASKRMDYETAAQYRDQIKLIRDSSRAQRVDLADPGGRYDLFGVCEGERDVCLAVLHVRDGVLIGSRRFLIRRLVWDMSSAERDEMVVRCYLDNTQDLPAEVLLPESAGFDAAALQASFDSRPGARVRVHVPQRGTKRQLVALAEKNARLYLAQKAPCRAADALVDLQETLKLPVLPRVIEAFDISNLGGAFAVAGMVQFVEGAPNKNGYRRFKIQAVEGQDDYAMLVEAVTRRLSRLVAEKRPFPDVLLIDGGRGQLSSVAAAIGRFEHPPAVIALAKEEEVLHSPYVDGEVRLPATHPARRLVQRIRDEVHRYALAYHRTLRGGQFRSSTLEKITGVGPAKARALLKAFGSVRNLREADMEAIAAVVPRSVAERVVRALAGEDTPTATNNGTAR